jgi:hypothetical protein
MGNRKRRKHKIAARVKNMRKQAERQRLQQRTVNHLQVDELPTNPLPHFFGPTVPISSKEQTGAWSNVTRFLGWDGFSFVFTFPLAVGFLAIDEFDAARACFSISALALGLKSWTASSKYLQPTWKRVCAVSGVVTAIVFFLITMSWVHRRQSVEANILVIGNSGQSTAISYVPSVDLLYDSAAMAFNFYNHGQTNIYLWGDRLDNGTKSIDAPRTVTPSGTYHIWAQNVAKELREKLGNNSELRIPFDVYVTTEDKRQHTLKYSLWARTKDGALTIETQNLGTIDVDFH